MAAAKRRGSLLVPAAIPNGGGGGDPTTSELAAYNSAKSKPPSEQTAQDQETIKELEAKLATIAAGWEDSGGTGGRQEAVRLEVAAFAGRLEGARLASINQWARSAAAGGPQSRKAQSEMHGADTEFIIELARLLYELRDRVNAEGIP